MEDKKNLSPTNKSKSFINKVYKNPYLRYILFGLILALVPTLAESKIRNDFCGLTNIFGLLKFNFHHQYFYFFQVSPNCDYL